MKYLLLALVFTTSIAASPISVKYDSLGGAAGFLGAATSAEKTAHDGVGKFQRYQNGSIYSHPECGVRVVHGLIHDRYAALGFEQSFLGYPITDERASCSSLRTLDGTAGRCR